MRVGAEHLQRVQVGEVEHSTIIEGKRNARLR
jgi:hypothetical protein